MKWVKSSFTLVEGSWCEPYINSMKAWKHILKTEDLGIVIASSRRAAEKLWKKHFPQSEEPDSCYFLEESTDFSKIEGPECVKDWNDQLSRRYLMEHSMRLDEYLCPLSFFEGDSCKSCLSWTVCPYNEFTDFLVDSTGKLISNNTGEEITSQDFERRQLYEINKLKKLSEYEQG